jgi:hypothetical protein
MNKTHWVRILCATMLLAFLGGCAGMDRPAGSQQKEESAFPSG